MPTFDTFSEWLTDLLDRAGDDPADTTGDHYTTGQRQLVRAYHEVLNPHPFLFLRVDPPGAFRTTAPRTTGTVSVTQGSTAITFSSAPATSVQGLEIHAGDSIEDYRIATHTAGAAAATLDLAFSGATNAAATYTVYQREYNLVAGLRHIESMIVRETGYPIRQMEELTMRRDFPDPPHAVWPPEAFARIGEQRIRFNGYPNVARGIEYAYTRIPDDPDLAGTVTIFIPRNWRYVVVDQALYWVYLVKNDSRADAAGIIAASGRQALIDDDARKRMTLGAQPARGSAYQ